MESNERRKRAKKESSSKLAAFERLKQAKSEGKKHKYEVAPIENVYEEVSEKEYTNTVLKRQEDDWIVGDYGAEGYVEDGREIFDDDLDEESIKKNQKNNKKRDRFGARKDVETPKGNIEKMIASMPIKRKREIKLDEDDVLGSLMEELDSPSSKIIKADVKPVDKLKEEKMKAEEYLKSFNSTAILKIPKPISKSEIKKRPSMQGTVPAKLQTDLKQTSVTADIKNVIKSNSTDFQNDLKKEDVVDLNEVEVEQLTHLGEIKPKPTAQIEFDEVDGAAFEIDDEMFKINDGSDMKNNTPDVVFKSTEIPVEETKYYITEEQLCNGWETVSAISAVPENEKSTASITGDFEQLPWLEKEDKKFLKFFYWDAYEDTYNQPGTIFLFGKVWLESVQVYASCCIIIKNIPRRVFLLPRERKYDLVKKQSTDEVVKMIDVYQEFSDKVADTYKIMQFKTRKVTKNYAFNVSEVPDTSDYLEVQYPATDKPLPSNLNGETFSHIFGTSTGYLELFLLERKIKGPSWLNISGLSPASHSASWCKFELICDDMKNVSVLNEGEPPPPLVTMALKIRVTPIPKSHENQITMIGWLVHNNFCTDKAAPTPQFKDHFCVLTKPSDVMWPLDSKATKEELSKRSATVLEKIASERELLNLFLAKFHKIDPDLIVGHDIYGFDIGTLIHRLVVNKIMHWSRLGRLRRAKIPNFGKNFAERNIMCGRLLCDIKISAKELIRARSYDLESLCEQVLYMKEGKKKEIKAEEINDMYSSTDSLASLIKLTMQDALYILRIMYDLNVIPLSLQITNIAGNVMSRTLMGGRSERNEFLLLHAFNDKNYIVPDKVFAKKTLKDNNDGGLQLQPGTKGKRKPQYEGGLVLEPKKGFYDKLVLLMDFNSLYPSIIQEYNICFTTISIRGINFNNEVDLLVLMNHLPSNAEPGILPTEIKKLVESRRQVKALMNNPGVSSDLKHQYDIRQLALKLTANSMYGCLGFPNSRFYAKPLAAMVTAKGREILLNTRDLVQKLNYDVIYGDTDSLMINTNCTASNYDEVFNIGKKIKIEVNKLYKQIELDIDGVFQYMLLLKKKKYAAVTLSKVNGKLVSKQEIKGLDMVRRDWSQLSASAGKFVLSQILSDQNLDDKLANIHARLAQLKIDLEENKVPLPLLAITKQLTKNPEEYPDKKALPHVQVAIRMNSTMAKKFKQGDTIAYVICDDGTVNAATQRAYHVDELKTMENLKIDVKYYLSQQIHPVVTRLCEPIDGIDAVHIADTLGLDAAAYHSIRKMDASINDDDEITVDETDRYKNCDKFEFKCSDENCGIINTLDAPAIKNEDGNFVFLLQRCCNVTCTAEPFEDVARIQNKLWRTMQDYIHTYYQYWMICEDPTCGYRTRNITKINKSFEPECPQCKRNNLIREYTESQLYNQLCYFHFIFDTTMFMTKHPTARLELQSPLAIAYSKLKETVSQTLASNAYNIIDLRKISQLLLMK